MSFSRLAISDFSNAFTVSFLAPSQSDAADAAVPGNVTYVRKENAHPARVQHVLEGRHKPKQIARAKRCLLILIADRVKH